MVKYGFITTVNTMEKYINEYGKEYWKNVCESDAFSNDPFSEAAYNPEDHYQVVFHSNLGSITILDRLTGFGWRDVETGFRDTDNNFWLASGLFDIRDRKPKTIGEAIALIKHNANTCVPEIK